MSSNSEIIDESLKNWKELFDKQNNSNTCDRKFSSVKTEKIKHTNKEVVYTYVTENK